MLPETIRQETTNTCYLLGKRTPRRIQWHDGRKFFNSKSQLHAPPKGDRTTDMCNTHVNNVFIFYQITTLLLGLNNYYEKIFIKLHKNPWSHALRILILRTIGSQVIKLCLKSKKNIKLPLNKYKIIDRSCKKIILRIKPVPINSLCTMFLFIIT